MRGGGKKVAPTEGGQVGAVSEAPSLEGLELKHAWVNMYDTAIEVGEKLCTQLMWLCGNKRECEIIEFETYGDKHAVEGTPKSGVIICLGPGEKVLLYHRQHHKRAGLIWAALEMLIRHGDKIARIRWIWNEFMSMHGFYETAVEAALTIAKIFGKDVAGRAMDVWLRRDTMTELVRRAIRASYAI